MGINRQVISIPVVRSSSHDSYFSAELFYHKVVQASETFPKSDFQSYMRHFLADNGLDYVNFTFLRYLTIYFFWTDDCT